MGLVGMGTTLSWRRACLRTEYLRDEDLVAVRDYLAPLRRTTGLFSSHPATARTGGDQRRPNGSVLTSTSRGTTSHQRSRLLTNHRGHALAIGLNGLEPSVLTRWRLGHRSWTKRTSVQPH